MRIHYRHFVCLSDLSLPASAGFVGCGLSDRSDERRGSPFSKENGFPSALFIGPFPADLPGVPASCP